MAEEYDAKLSGDDLRSRAEARLGQELGVLENMSQEEIQGLVHELRTHEIELELQNEELRLAQLDLARSRDRFRDLYDFAPIGYLTICEKGMITEANLRLADMLAVERSSLIGRHLNSCICESDQDNFYHQRRGAFADGAPRVCRLCIRRADDSWFWAEVYMKATPNPAKNEIQCRIAISDISELRDVEATLHQSQRLEALGTMAGGLAHHLNNMLQVVVGFTQLSLDALAADPDHRQNLQRVLTSAQSGAKLIRQLLAFSRADSPCLATVYPQVLMQETVQLLQGVFPPGVEIRVEAESPCGVIRADANELQQVLVNLCTNAKQALPEAGGTIRILLSEVDLPSSQESGTDDLVAGRYAKIAVIDEGAGMSEETLQRAFEPFYSTKEPFAGTGLGLSTSHGIISSHGGAIEINSVEGAGTTVRLYLPIHRDAGQFAPDRVPAKRGGDRKPRILFVDDEPDVTDLLGKHLTRRGFEVVTCVSSTEALSVFERAPDSIDLVIADQVMPDIRGSELAERVEAIRPGTPFILLSGLLEGIGDYERSRAGISMEISKPVMIADLEQAIHDVMEDRDRTNPA